VQISYTNTQQLKGKPMLAHINCDRCLSEDKLPRAAMAYIPLPAYANKPVRRIYLCPEHYQQAIQHNFFVQLLYSNNPKATEADFERRILHKHLAVRGTLNLRQYQQSGGVR
jgi:hypothetical protein